MIELGLGPVGNEQISRLRLPDVSKALSMSRVIVVPVARPIFDEGSAIRAAVEVGVELVSPEECDPVAIVDVEAVGEFSGVTPDVDVPVPVGEYSDQLRVSPLIGSSTRVRWSCPSNFTRTPFRPIFASGASSVSRREIALAGADVTRRIEAIAFIVEDQNAILQVVDQVKADVDLGDPVAKQGVLDRASELPSLLRHEVGIAGIYPIGATARPN